MWSQQVVWWFFGINEGKLAYILLKRAAFLCLEWTSNSIKSYESLSAFRKFSLLCGPISPVLNLEMSSTARFFCGNAIYGCSGLGNCRMLNFLSIAFCVIDLISMLITWNHYITNIFRINLSRYFVFVYMPTFSTVRISHNFVSVAFCVIDLISTLIRWNHSITNIFRITLSRDLVFVSIPTFSSVRISNKIVKCSHRPPKIENQHGRHIYDEVNRKFAITFWFFKIETWFKCPSPYFRQQ